MLEAPAKEAALQAAEADAAAATAAAQGEVDGKKGAADEAKVQRQSRRRMTDSVCWAGF